MVVVVVVVVVVVLAVVVLVRPGRILCGTRGLLLARPGMWFVRIVGMLRSTSRFLVDIIFT